RLSTSTLSTTGLRGRRVVGRPTLTSAADERKLGPDAPWAGVVTPAAGAAPTIVSFGSGVTGTVAASSRSFDDSAPRNRFHSCSSDFLNIWLLLEGLTRNTPDRAATQYRPLCKVVAGGGAYVDLLTTLECVPTMPQ